MKYNKKWFEFSDAEKFLGESKNNLFKIIHDLKISGWLEVKKHPSNPRKRVYKLVNFEIIIKMVAKSKK